MLSGFVFFFNSSSDVKIMCKWKIEKETSFPFQKEKLSFRKQNSVIYNNHAEGTKMYNPI